MTSEQRLSALEEVVAHPRFFQLERAHYAHLDECPELPFIDQHGSRVCWHWQVGVAIREGRVDWFYGITCAEACESASSALAKSG
jgi:hypothetical protein